MTRLLAAIAAVALLLTGVVKGGSAEAAEADPMVGAPAAGDCYDLTLKQVYQPSTTKSPVDCSKKHTLLVGAVGEVPASVGWKDQKALWKQAQRICDPFWNKQTSKSEVVRYYTLLETYWLMPTKAQKKNGARWISCLVGLRTVDSLVPFSGDTLARASKRPDKSIGRCVTRTNDYTPCSKPHVLRATYVFPTRAKGSDEARYERLKRAAARVCPSRTPGKGFVWSSRLLDGTKYVVACYTRTRN